MSYTPVLPVVVDSAASDIHTTIQDGDGLTNDTRQVDDVHMASRVYSPEVEELLMHILQSIEKLTEVMVRQ